MFQYPTTVNLWVICWDYFQAMMLVQTKHVGSIYPHILSLGDKDAPTSKYHQVKWGSGKDNVFPTKNATAYLPNSI